MKIQTNFEKFLSDLNKLSESELRDRLIDELDTHRRTYVINRIYGRYSKKRTIRERVMLRNFKNPL